MVSSSSITIHVITILAIALYVHCNDIKFPSKCAEDRIVKADKCAKNGFFLLDDEYDGQGSQNVDAYCRKVNESLTCVADFNRDCLKGFVKQSANSGITGMKKHYRSICVGKKPKRKEFITKTKWLKKKEIEKLSPCVQASVKNMNEISTKTTNSKQIPEACCNYVLTRECLKSKTRSLTSEENLHFIESMADEALGGLVSTICTNNGDKKQCASRNKEAMARMKLIYNNPGPKEKFESILIPFLNILSE